MCVPGYHGPAGGPCEPCEAGSWCYGGIQNPCPLHHSSDAMAGGLDDCRCVDGYGSDGGGNCVGCGDTEYQSFSNTSAGDTCLSCPPNRAQDATGASCDCAVGWDVSAPELPGASGCDVCAFSYSDDGGGGCGFCSDVWVCVNGTVEDCEYCAVNEEETVPGSRGAVYRGVPVHALRLPGRVAQQEVFLGGAGEVLTLKSEVFSVNRLPAITAILRAKHALHSTRCIRDQSIHNVRESSAQCEAAATTLLGSRQALGQVFPASSAIL